MIQPEFKPLIDILSGKLFSIPEYQRHYSWTNKQRTDLFKDILKLLKAREIYEDRVHFMATLVCLKTHDKKQIGSNSFFIYEVVDGQQRLTTLIILLKAISKRLFIEKQFDEEKELNKILLKDDGRLIILQNNHDNRMLLRNYLKDGSIPNEIDIKTIADENISQAIKQCEKFVNSSAIDTISLLSLVKNYLYFIFQSLEDKGAVYTIFEVLNSRGLDVDWLDKCKSMLMGLLYEYSLGLDSSIFDEHLKSLHSYWSNIYREIGLQSISGQEIIRFAATLKQNSDAGRPISAEDALEFFRDHSTSKKVANIVIKTVEEDTIWIKQVTSALSILYKDKRRNAVTEITQARLLAVAIMLRNDLSQEDRDRLLEQWEKTTFRIYGLLDNDARVKVGDYVRVAKTIYKDKTISVINLIKLIADIGKEYSIEDAIIALEKKDCYTSWKKELRYFFFRYEEYLSKQSNIQIDNVAWNIIWKNNLNDTIEHILPQDIRQKCWSNNFTDIQHKEFLNTLGNLCLLSQPLNAEAKNSCFNTKKETYIKTTLLSNRNIINKEDGSLRQEWKLEEIQIRTRKLLEFAKEEWKDI
ncbi:DUF262 domain-containing protein [Emticicia soli]|uniref:DUF262 domain-containing protein n=1 Tax=Emticicia soli TaxID=2027878 RepID=A0ABW5JB54_9BACT